MRSLITFVLLFASPSITMAQSMVMWSEKTTIEILTLPEKQALGPTVNAAFGISAAHVDSEYCEFNVETSNWHCIGKGGKTLTDLQYFQADLRGELEDPVSGETIKKEEANLTEQLIVDHSTVTNSVFGKNLVDLAEFRFWRNPDLPSQVLGQAAVIVVGTPTQYKTARQADLVHKPLAVIED